jgi:glycosyltransferase involved in cell wall biosynthesis
MKTVLTLSPYSVVPPQYGGAIRIYNLCRELSKHYRVMHFAQQVQKEQVKASLFPVVQSVTPTYTEYSSRDPLSILLYGVACTKLKCPPILQSEVLGMRAPRWLQEQIAQAVVVNVEHPWQFAWAYEQVGGNTPIVITAHNVEAALCTAEQINAPEPIAQYLMQEVEKREGFALRHATRVLTMSAEDTATFVKRYGVDPERCVVIPNGVDCQAFTPATPQQRSQRKQELGFADQCLIVFAGSTHLPNREAVQQIVDWAEDWHDPRVHFLIVGSVGRAFTHIQLPNVTFTGLVESTQPYFEAADIAINPMLSGSGTNLKQVEYMAMGLPSVATPIGARGISLEDGKHGYISSLMEFPAKLRWLTEHPELYASIGNQARSFAEQNFDWSVIGAKLLQVYQELEGKPHESTLCEATR